MLKSLNEVTSGRLLRDLCAPQRGRLRPGCGAETSADLGHFHPRPDAPAASRQISVSRSLLAGEGMTGGESSLPVSTLSTRHFAIQHWQPVVTVETWGGTRASPSCPLFSAIENRPQDAQQACRHILLTPPSICVPRLLATCSLTWALATSFTTGSP